MSGDLMSGGDPTGGVKGACLHCVGAPRARSGVDEELNAALLQRLEAGAGFYALLNPNPSTLPGGPDT